MQYDEFCPTATINMKISSCTQYKRQKRKRKKKKREKIISDLFCISGDSHKTNYLELSKQIIRITDNHDTRTTNMYNNAASAIGS